MSEREAMWTRQQMLEQHLREIRARKEAEPERGDHLSKPEQD